MSLSIWMPRHCSFKRILFVAFLVIVPAFPANAAEALRELARISVGAEPLGLDVGRDGQVIVAAAGARSLHVINADSLKETHRLDLSAHGRLSRVYVSPHSANVFVSASIKGKILKLGPNAASVEAELTTGGFPQGMAEIDGKLLVALTGGQALAIIDPGTMSAERRIDAGDRPTRVRVDEKAGRLYVVKSTTRSLWVYDAATLKWMRSITDPSLVRLSDMAIAADGRLLVLDGATDELLIMDAGGGRIEARVPLLAKDCVECTHVPMGLALSADGGRAAVVGRGGWVSLIDLKAQKLIAARLAGRDLRGVEWAGDERIFATSFGSSEVVVLDGRQK